MINQENLDEMVLQPKKENIASELVSWRGYVDQKIEVVGHEKILGSTFDASTPDQYRMKQLQDQVLIPLSDRRAKEYMEKTLFLMNYFQTERLERVYELMGYMTGVVQDKDLIPTILALYELELFVETQQLLDERIYKEIIEMYIIESSDRKLKYRKESKSQRTNTISITFFHVLSKTVRELYTQRGNLFNFNNYLVQQYSSIIKSFIDTFLYNQPEIDLKVGTNERLNHPDIQNALRELQAPRIFVKLMFSYHVKQECRKLAYQLQQNPVKSEIVTPELLKRIGEEFTNCYLTSNKQLKTPNLLVLTILRLIDQQIVKKFQTKYTSHPPSRDYNAITNRHGEFLKNILEKVLQRENSSPQVIAEKKFSYETIEKLLLKLCKILEFKLNEIKIDLLYPNNLREVITISLETYENEFKYGHPIISYLPESFLLFKKKTTAKTKSDNFISQISLTRENRYEYGMRRKKK